MSRGIAPRPRSDRDGVRAEAARHRRRARVLLPRGPRADARLPHRQDPDVASTAFADELEREKARQRTYDAMMRKARAGHVTGGRVFGYDNVEILGADGRRSHVERAINDARGGRRPTDLRTLRRGCRQGADRADAERGGRAGAAGATADGREAWVAVVGRARSCSRELYRGVIVWNRTKKRNQWGQQKQKARPPSDHLRVPMPELRIVAEPVWLAAHERLDESRALYFRSTNGHSWGRPPSVVDAKYLLTGLAECGRCGGTIEVRSRSHGRHRAFFYMCSTHRRRGAQSVAGSTCRWSEPTRRSSRNSRRRSSTPTCSSGRSCARSRTTPSAWSPLTESGAREPAADDRARSYVV